MPLSFLCVLDLTTVRSGPTCTRLLADLGARVICVEPRGTEPRLREFYDEADLHRGKERLTLDLKKPEGVAILTALVRRADVLVENYRPRVKGRLGIDYGTLRAVNPRLIYASISGFGQGGPYVDRPGYDQIIQGVSGLMSLTGTGGTGPLRVGIPIADLLAGYAAAHGILAALVERERSGQGQAVETSLLQALVGALSFQAGKYLNTGEVPPPVGNHHPLASPMGVYRAQDGHMTIACGSEEMWGRFCRALDREGWAEDPRFAMNRDRVINREELSALIEARLAVAPVAHWVERLNEAGVASGPIHTVDQVFADPQVQALGLVAETHQPGVGAVKVLAQPFTLSRTPARVRGPVPRLGETTEKILIELGYTSDEIARLRADEVI